MQNYAKQEGFVVIPAKERGGVIRWRCIHGGKYNDWRKQPANITDKSLRQEKVEAGMRPYNLTEGEKIRQRRGASLKQGCPFYVAFMETKNDSDYYQCSGINAGHLCARDPDSVDRYHQYRKGDSVVLARAATMMRNVIICI